MKTYFLVMLAAMLLFAGCSKKQQALEEMQQPMSPDDLTKLKTQTSETISATAQAPAEATIVSSSGQKLEPLPPSGPFKPTAKGIQTALKNAGLYSGAIDGKLGPMSTKAVEEFQKANGLVADGKVGPKTWAAMSKYLSSPVAASAAENVRQ
jgi:peptidoglycan hydrolase-like protein with peptidoglycan-binding domain